MSISVPVFTKLKARQIPGFASLEAYPYAEVRARLTLAIGEQP